MREVEAAADGGNDRAKLAISMFVYRVRKYIGAYIAAMNGIDAIVFTGGIGENNQPIREAVCLGLSGLGVDLDLEQNKKIRGVEGTISTPSSKIKVIVIPTDEEYMIASDTLDLVKK